MSLSSSTLNKHNVIASTSKPPGSSTDVVSEFSVKVCNHPDKRYSLLRFHAANKLDFTKAKDIRMQRENNFRQYKTAYDIVDMPTEGAGSEYGREQREEARRKKLGFSRRVYNPQYQPWLLSVGKGKEEKRYKGTQEGGISDNVAYFAFVQSSDGGFLAYPISDWYNMTPEINYRYLKEDEAEEEYTRRHKQLNLFNVMVKKRMNDAQEEEMADNEGDGGGDLMGFNKGAQKKRSTKKKNRSFKLTEMDDWLGSSDEADADSDGGDKAVDKDSDDDKKSKKKNSKKRKQKTKDDVDSEGFEDSDLDDHDGDEVDYMTHSSSDEEKLSADEREKLYKEEGVDQEVALKALLTDMSSDDEGAEEKTSDAEEKKDEEKSKSSKVPNPADSSNSSDNGESSSSTGEDSDSEIDKKAATAVAYQRRLSAGIDNHVDNNSQSAAAQSSDDQSKSASTSRKRPFPNSGDSNMFKFETAAKKSAYSSSQQLANSKLSGLDNSILTQVESEVRKYLLRKPISAKELLKKIRQKNIVPKNFETSHVLANVLRKLNPQRIKVQGDQKLHLKG